MHNTKKCDFCAVILSSNSIHADMAASVMVICLDYMQLFFANHLLSRIFVVEM